MNDKRLDFWLDNDFTNESIYKNINSLFDSNIKTIESLLTIMFYDIERINLDNRDDYIDKFVDLIGMINNILNKLDKEK